MRNRCRSAIVVGLILAAGSPLLAESVSDLLEKAIYTEQTVGDLAKAMVIYEKIIADERASRSCVAQAQYRLGMCHLNRGQRDRASEAFKRVLLDFPQQRSITAKATAALARLGLPVGEQPLVLGTTPPAFADGVAPSLKAITVTFDQPMADKSWSWTQMDKGRTFPKITGGASYDAARTTCTVPVVLAPGKVYWVGINSVSHRYFQSANRIPARRHVILFATRGADGKRTRIPKDMLDKARDINAPPPVVVKTTPAAFANDVSPRLREISVTFSRPMMDKSWSWTYTDQKLYPKTAGQPSYDAKKTTCTLPVRLQAGRVYWVGINSPGGGYFQTPMKVRACDHAILFATKSKDGKPTPIPQQLIDKAKQINEAPVSRAAEASKPEPLTLQPAAWKDGEVMRLSLNTTAGAEVGTIIYTARTADTSGKKAWRLESCMAVPLSQTTQYTRVDADRDTFAPITGRTKNQLGDFNATYATDTVALTSELNGKKSTRTIKLDGVAYDNEQVLFLLRCLPLREGYWTAFNIFPVQGATVVECRIKVTGKETVKVPAGSFECYRMDLEVYAAGTRSLQHELWFSADPHRYLVKYDSRQAVMELVEVAVRKDDDPVPFRDEQRGISMSAPAGWDFYPAAMTGHYKYMLYLLPPEMAALCVLIGDEIGATPTTSAREAAEGDVKVLKRVVKDYTIRPGSRTDAKQAGIPTSSFVADYKDKGKAMVEYRVYIVGKSMVYWFVFRTGKDAFEPIKPDLDAIVASFKTE